MDLYFNYEDSDDEKLDDDLEELEDLDGDLVTLDDEPLNESNGVESKKDIEIENLGYQNIKIAEIDDRLIDELVKSREDFRKYSFEQIADGFERLEQTVRPGYEAGLRKEDFEMMDIEQGLSGPDGYAEIFTAYYDAIQDPIRLEMEDGKYTNISAGAHRLYAARALGVESLPGLVTNISRKSR